VRLIDHVGRIESGPRIQGGFHQFVEDQEQLVRIDRARVQIIVPVLAVIEVKATQLAEAMQPGDDLLDVGVGRMVTQVDQALGLRPELLRGKNG